MMQEFFFNDVAVGWLKKINVRYTYSTFEGRYDALQCPDRREIERSIRPVGRLRIGGHQSREQTNLNRSFYLETSFTR
jgi:hypothetical protein